MKIYRAEVKYSVVEEGPVEALSTPEAAYRYMKSAFDERPLQESFWVVLLTRKNKPIARYMVSLGTLDSAPVACREVFRLAIMVAASSVLCAHNHPSGSVLPSSADITITKQLVEAGKLLGLHVMDHIICGDAAENSDGKAWYSFREAGLI